MRSTVDDLHEEFSAILAVLLPAYPSLYEAANDAFRKYLLLAAASYFEARLTQSVVAFAAKATAEGHILARLVENKVVHRNYHTWFEWERPNANRFFAMFGKEFRTHMEKSVKQHKGMDASIKAFMELGLARNKLAHGDIAAFSFNKSSEEVYKTYKQAEEFVEWFPRALAEFAENPPADHYE